MKLKKLGTLTQNKVNKQMVFHIRIKMLRKMNLKPEDILELSISKKSKSKKGKKNGK